MSLFEEDLIYDDDLDDAEESSGQYSAETVDQFVSPQAMSFCLGHEPQEQLFIELFEKKAMPHAMIFSGRKGVGKATTAFRLARFLLKHGKTETQENGLFGEEECKPEYTSLDIASSDPVFSRIASGGHADFLYIERFFDTAKGRKDPTLKVESVRRIEPFLRRTSSEGGWRIVIVDDADTMNRNAQNAILKILEEPPNNVLIILIAHRPGLLIPTIRSRARLVPFSALSDDDMKDLLERGGHSFAASQFSAISDFSEGSIGSALSFIEEEGLETLAKTLAYLDDYPNWNWAKIHEFSNSLSSPAQTKEYLMFVRVLLWVMRQLLFMKAKGENEVSAYLETEGLQHFMQTISLERLIDVHDRLKQHFEAVEFSNLDKRDAVRGSFLVISD